VTERFDESAALDGQPHVGFLPSCPGWGA